MTDKLPFYIVTFNRIKGLEYALEFVGRSTLPLELIILDMGSTWPPFLKYLSTLTNQVVYFSRGVGPRDLWVNGTLARIGTGPFFLSDGDIDYSAVSEDSFENLVALSNRFPWFPKIGLALDDSDLPTDFEGQRIRAWSKYDWAVRWSSSIYLSGVDTTLAYYPKRINKFYYRPALRLAGRNTARHYPWYERDNQNNPEYEFYRTAAMGEISTGQQALFPSRSFKIKSIIRLLLMRSLKFPLYNRFLGKISVNILSWKGTIEELK